MTCDDAGFFGFFGARTCWIMTKMMFFWLFFDYIISKQFNLETLSSLLKIVASCDDSIKVHKTCWEG